MDTYITDEQIKVYIYDHTYTLRGGRRWVPCSDRADDGIMDAMASRYGRPRVMGDSGAAGWIIGEHIPVADVKGSR